MVRAVKLLPNGLLDVLGGHDGFPVEALGWSAGRKMLRSFSHDECIRLWVRIVLFAHRNVSLSTSMMQKRRQLERQRREEVVERIAKMIGKIWRGLRYGR